MEVSNTEKLIPLVTYIQSAYDKSADTIGSRPAESLAVLVGDPTDNVVQKIIFDAHSENTRSTTTLNTTYLNPAIKKMWQDYKLRVIGIEHSQPGLKRPSQPDLDYFAKMSEALNLETLITPILFTTPDGGFKVFPYIYHRSTGKVTEAELLVISESAYKRQKKQLMKVSKEDTPTSTVPTVVPVKTKDRFKKMIRYTTLFCHSSFNLLATLLLILAGWIAISITPSIIVRLTETLLP